MSIKCIILDFDGVILESVSVKTNAFRSLFSFAPRHVDEIVRFHIDNGGMSRFEKFRYIYDNILKQELDPSTFNTLSERFSGLVFQSVLDAPFVPGAAEFLEQWSGAVSLFIVSATPEQELNDIIRARNLTHFFRKVYGAPRKKPDCIRSILAESGLSPSEVLFVGDAQNDLNAAQISGVRFIGRVADGDEDIFKDKSGCEKRIKDLNELTEYLEHEA